MCQVLTDSRVAQSVEQVAVNHLVGGSSPSPGAIVLCRDSPLDITEARPQQEGLEPRDAAGVTK